MDQVSGIGDGSDHLWRLVERHDQPALAVDTTCDEVLIVDPGIAEAAILIDGLRPGVEALHLTAGGNGLEQIANLLDGRRGLSALHILCHGEAGALMLAGHRVDLPALAVRPGVLAAISEALDPDGVVAVYGSSVASGSAGLHFLDYLETVLGVGVAASAGPVGAAALGGRWILRDRHGAAIDTAFTSLSRASFPDLL